MPFHTITPSHHQHSLAHTAHITGLDAAEKKFGLPDNRAVNEKITDYGRDTYEKDTG